MAIGREPREPREQAPATPSPGQPPAPTLTYDPGLSSSSPSFSDVVSTGAAFQANPLATVIGGIVGSLFKKDRPWRGRKLVADSETGKITALTFVPGRAQNTAFGRTEQASLEALQKTFDTGLVQSGIAPWYAEFADALAAFRIELDLAAAPPGGHVPPSDVPGDTGEGFPPSIEPLPPGFGSDERGGPIGGPALQIPVDLRKLFMPVNPYMPFSGLPNPRSSSVSTGRRRKKKAGKKTVRRRRAGGKKARLVKGSAAAKRYMAKLRRMRK